MNMNTDHLGYKLISGKLKNTRKHSEQLNKFLAGFFDSDGNVTVFVDDRYNSIVLSASIVQSVSNDTDFEMMKSLQEFYGIGRLSVRSYEKLEHTDSITWSFNIKDTYKLFNLIGKHLFIKHDHFLNSILIFEEYKTKKQDKLFIKRLRENSREMSSMRHKHFKHLSPAYLAGLIAGDGWVEAVIGKRNKLSLEIKLNIQDGEVLEQIQKDFGGNLYYRGHDNCIKWRLNLGKQNKKALTLSNKLLSYMCLHKKYVKLEEIVNFHKQLAETKRL